MYENTEFTLSRDCEAIQIPSGQKTTVPAGTQGVITQSLGGSYTIATYQGLARIEEKDLDAMGLEKPQAQPTQKPARSTDGEVSEEDVWNQLRQCYDPEIPVNIVDLGLVYDCRLIKRDDGGTRVEVKMTLTAPGCGSKLGTTRFGLRFARRGAPIFSISQDRREAFRFSFRSLACLRHEGTDRGSECKT